MVEELDWSVGRILETLKKYKLDKNTFVVFFSDNGPVINRGSTGGYRGCEGSSMGTLSRNCHMPGKRSKLITVCLHIVPPLTIPGI